MSKNILDFLPAMKQKTAHEWCGSCLSCGGNDRFNVWPGRPGGGYYMCRGCDPQGGDGIQFMRKYMGMSYAEACAALGIEPKRTTTSLLSARRVHSRRRPARPVQTAPVPPKPEPAVLPCPEWMDSAAAFLAECQRDLETSPEALLAVTGRFLTPDTAHRVGIGWNPTDLYPLRKSWGLPDIAGQDGKLRTKLLIPRGLVIATRRKAGIVALTVRCPNDRLESRPKYWQVKGSADVPFVAGRAGLPVVLVESALDAALLWQESFSTVSSVALMGNMKGLDADTNDFIQAAPLLLAAPDRDGAGEKAWARWSTIYPHAHFAPVLHGKDVGEQHAAAHAWPLDYSIPTTNEWITAVLSATAPDMAHTGPMSHENTQPDHCATSGMKEAA